MDIGLICAPGPPELVTRYVETAEQVGFASLWVPEHVAFFDDYSPTYPYSSSGRPPMTTETGMLDPLAFLTFIAARTTRVRLATGVLLVPQRNPLYTAKQATTVDLLSGGRLDLGIGVGWLEEEFRALGVPYEARGARCDEYLEVIRRLWCDERAAFSGRFYELEACVQEPRPVQKPHPPILVGGVAEPALRRAARQGDGWIAINLTPEEAAAHLAHIAELRGEAGRSMEGFRASLMATAFEIKPDDLPRYREAGIGQIVLPPMRGDRVITTPDELFAMIEEISHDFVEPARKL
jgi:probable F420-dependent oxidoreductase